MNKIEKLTGANYKALININPYTWTRPPTIN